MIYKKIFFLIGAVSFLTAAARAQTDEFHLDETYEIDPNGTILLKSDDADVTIVGTSRENVRVIIDYELDTDGFSFGDYERFEMKVWQEGGDLYIEEQPREMDRVVIGNTDETYTIRIEAPYNAGLKLQGDDENYDISEIDGEIRIDADDSEITLTACSGSYFAFRLDDGTIRMDEGSGSLNMDVDDGNAFIQNGNFKTIKLYSDDGEFSIHNRPSAGGNYQFELEDGTLDLYLEGAGSQSGPIELGIDTDDSDIAIHADLNPDDSYSIDMNDADLEFYATSGGAVFTFRFDNADVDASEGYELLSKHEHRSRYRLGSGGAEIRIEADDADIALRE